MLTAIAIFGVVFAAICVWLTVRIVNRRERWAKWTLAAIIGVPVLYLLTFGPACWITSKAKVDDKRVANRAMIIYFPLGKVVRNDPNSRFCRALIWWMSVGTPDGHLTVVPIDARGKRQIEIDPLDL